MNEEAKRSFLDFCAVWDAFWSSGAGEGPSFALLTTKFEELKTKALTPGEYLYEQQKQGWQNAIPWDNLSQETKSFWEDQARLRSSNGL